MDSWDEIKIQLKLDLVWIISEFQKNNNEKLFERRIRKLCYNYKITISEIMEDYRSYIDSLDVEIIAAFTGLERNIHIAEFKKQTSWIRRFLRR